MSANVVLNNASVQSLNEHKDISPFTSGNNVGNESAEKANDVNRVTPAKELQKTIEAKEVEESREKQAKLEVADIDSAIEVVSSFINQPPRNVNFFKDDSSGKTVIKVFDKDSKELIKQFPSEEIISIAQKISTLQQEVGQQTGILLDEKV